MRGKRTRGRRGYSRSQKRRGGYSRKRGRTKTKKSYGAARGGIWL